MIQNGNNKRLRYDQLCYIGNDKNIDCKNKKREEIEKEIKKKTNNKIQDENWKTLTIDTLLLLCFKNQKYATIMKDNKTWIYLLERDYSQTYRGKNAKSQYLKIQNHVNIDTNYLLNLSSYVIFLGKNHYYDFLQYPLLHLSKFPSLYFSSSLPHFPSLFDSLIS